MAHMIIMGSIPVKATRRTPRPDRPFGQGLVCHTSQDESWWLERLREAERDQPTDQEYDAMAAIAAWEYRYEQGLTGEGRCAVCGRVTDDLTGGLCDGCALSLDAEGPEDDPQGGVCPVCHAWSDFVEQDTGLCPVCDLKAADGSFSGNHGY